MRHAWQTAHCSRGVVQHLTMLCLPEHVVCIVDASAARERERSVSHGSAGKELVGRSSIT